MTADSMRYQQRDLPGPLERCLQSMQARRSRLEPKCFPPTVTPQTREFHGPFETLLVLSDLWLDLNTTFFLR
jgi:hypothetical protein